MCMSHVDPVPGRKQVSSHPGAHRTRLWVTERSLLKRPYLVHVAFSDLLKEKLLPSRWFLHPLMVTTRRLGHTALNPCFAACVFPAGLPGRAGGAVPATPASPLRCPSRFGGSLRHPIRGPPAVLGPPPPPPLPPRPSASLHGSVSVCAMTAGLRVFLLSPRGLARLSAAPSSLQPLPGAGAWQEVVCVPWTEG